MTHQSDIIECPTCGESIDVSSALTERLRKENDAKLAQARKAIKKAEDELSSREANLEAVVETQLSERMASERKSLKARSRRSSCRPRTCMAPSKGLPG